MKDFYNGNFKTEEISTFGRKPDYVHDLVGRSDITKMVTLQRVIYSFKLILIKFTI